MDAVFIKVYVSLIPIFLVLDMLWLGVFAKDFYAKHLEYIMSPNPNWIAAILFYALYIAGIIVFAVMPGVKESNLSKTILLGAFFGLCTYATYDLTNLATLRQWPIIVTVIDLIWGICISSVVAASGFYIARAIR
jgi:uncharacterized membrane protein